MQDMKDKLPNFKIPGYRLIRKVGEGGMSVVYLAYQESLKREVALKILRPVITDETDIIRRFEQEAEIIAKLYHPNIVNIYEVGHIDDSTLYYSMPYLQHGDLTTFTHHSDEQLIEVMVSICEALDFAHTQGVVHRDIKPENILFDQFGHVLLADFGIALSTGRSRLTRDSRIIGSVYYMSPEQAQAKHVDARSDIYGIGAILFEILTGDPVFDRSSDFDMMLAHVSDPVPKLPARHAHWQVVIDKCLAKSPNHRYQSAKALKDAIIQLKGETNPPQKSWKNIVGLASALVITCALVYLFWVKSESTIIENQAKVKLDQPKTQTPIAKYKPNSTQPLNEEPRPVINNLSDHQVSDLITKASENIEKKQLTTPASDNALDQLLLVLKNLPNHDQASSLLSDVMAGYYDLVYQSVQNNNLEQAMGFAESVAEVRHRTILTYENLYAALEENTDLERSLMIGVIAEKVQSAKRSKNKLQAERLIDLVDAVMPGHEIIDELTVVVNEIPEPGQVVTDNQGLRSVIIAPEMNGVKGVLNQALTVTETEISYAMFDRFVTATGHEIQRCKSKIGSNLIFSQRNYSRPGFAVKDDMPVVCVTWKDANLFINWYNQLSGEQYRLPSESEWRHLIKLSQLQQPECGSANLAGSDFPNDDEQTVKRSCDDGHAYVAPLKAFAPNSLGLYGLHGNVAEWLSGCQEIGKFKAIFNPDDQCDSNPSAGLSWLSGAQDVGEIQQINYDHAWSHIGFRLVKNL